MRSQVSKLRSLALKGYPARLNWYRKTRCQVQGEMASGRTRSAQAPQAQSAKAPLSAAAPAPLLRAAEPSAGQHPQISDPAASPGSLPRRLPQSHSGSPREATRMPSNTCWAK